VKDDTLLTFFLGPEDTDGVDELPDDLAHWADEADERDEFDLSQDPLWNERPSFDQDVYYDGFGDP
jgi:hypothetical protein